MLPPVPYLTEEGLNRFIAAALAEDVGDGDHSSWAAIPATACNRARLLVKGTGVLAGVEFGEKYFRQGDQ